MGLSGNLHALGCLIGEEIIAKSSLQARSQINQSGAYPLFWYGSNTRGFIMGYHKHQWSFGVGADGAHSPNLHRVMALVDGVNGYYKSFGFTEQTNPTFAVFSVEDPDNSDREGFYMAHDGDDAVYTNRKGGYVWGVEANMARGTLTLSGLPTADDDFVINGTTITAKADGSGDLDHFTIGGDADETCDNIAETINEGSESANCHAYAGAGDTVIVEWLTGGVAGNAIVFTEDMDNTAADGAGTLGGTHAGVAANANLMSLDENAFLTLVSGAGVNEFSTDGTLAGNSDTALPTEKAVKTYVDTKYYGTMHLNANANASVIETANTPIALRQFTTGALMNGWTFNAGSTGAITSYQIGTGGAGYTRVNAAANGLSNGDIVSIRGSSVADYLGIWEVSDVAAGYYDIHVALNGDGGVSDWDEPSHLIAGASAAGLYEIGWSMSSSEGGAAGSEFKFVVYIDTTPQVPPTAERKFANNDLGSFSGHGIVEIAVGNIVFLTAESDGVNAITNKSGSLTIHKM